MTTPGPTVPGFVARLGDAVRARRRDGGLTVQQLADAASVSRRMLTQIELGQANPSLVTVERIAVALGTDFASLVRAGPPRDAPGVLSVPPPINVWTSEAGSVAVLHATTGHTSGAELWEWTIEPHDRYDADPDAPGSDELFLVIDGTLTLIVHDPRPTTVVLNPGESARLASDRRYSYVNTGDAVLRFVRVVQLAR